MTASPGPEVGKGEGGEAVDEGKGERNDMGSYVLGPAVGIGFMRISTLPFSTKTADFIMGLVSGGKAIIFMPVIGDLRVIINAELR
jgi:hypothetical protein